MKDDVFKVMIFHGDKLIRKILKEEILKVVPNTLFVTASTKNTFLKKIGWITPDLVLSSATAKINFGLDALLYIKKNLSGIPFIYILDHKQARNNSLTAILAEADGIIDISQKNQIIKVINEILPGIKKYKKFREAEVLELYQQLLLAQKSIALSTKGYFRTQQIARLNILMNR